MQFLLWLKKSLNSKWFMVSVQAASPKNKAQELQVIAEWIAVIG